jgi:hypothetical protein
MYFTGPKAAQRAAAEEEDIGRLARAVTALTAGLSEWIDSAVPEMSKTGQGHRGSRAAQVLRNNCLI